MADGRAGRRPPELSFHARCVIACSSGRSTGRGRGKPAALLERNCTHAHAPSRPPPRERVSAPAMNRTVNCLQEAGYISRSADESDGRKV